MSPCCVRVGMPVEGPDALHVDDDRGDLGVVGEADELVHQRDARARGRGEGARAVPGGADHHADRGELVLGLQDEVVVRSLASVAPSTRSRRYRSQSSVKLSITEVDGVIGYQAATVAPA